MPQSLDQTEDRELLRSVLAASASPIARLRLPPALESAFVSYQESVALANLRAHWATVAVSITLIGLLVFGTDLVPERTRGLALFGFAVFYAIGAVVVASVLLDGLRPYLRLFAELATIGGLLAMHMATVLTAAPDPLHTIAQFGVILVTVAVFSIANLLLWQAALCWVIATLAFVGLLNVTVFEVEAAVFLVYTLGSAVVATLIGLAHEMRERTVFLQGRLLLLEKDEIDAMARELATLSRTDALTGLANRRSFDEALRREWAACQRDGEPVGLVLVDVDHFKRYNDHYGHPAGDACLTAVARALAAQATRPSDIVARYGGEEFVALFPRTDSEGVAAIAARMLAAVDALAMPHAAASGEDDARHVTVSVGVAVRVPVGGESAAMLLQRADAVLYRAKQGGRHRVELDRDDTSSSSPVVPVTG